MQRVGEKWPLGQPKAGGSEYLELHGAFYIALLEGAAPSNEFFYCSLHEFTGIIPANH